MWAIAGDAELGAGRRSHVTGLRRGARVGLATSSGFATSRNEREGFGLATGASSQTPGVSVFLSGSPPLGRVERLVGGHRQERL